METLIKNLPWIGAAAALIGALLFYLRVMRAPDGTPRMQELARAFLFTLYKILSVFVVAAAAGLFVLPEEYGGGIATALCFVVGAFSSALAGWIGMYTATRAAVRTTEAARTGLAPALTIAFSSGTVMGMTVVGLGILGVTGFSVLYSEEGVITVATMQKPSTFCMVATVITPWKA